VVAVEVEKIRYKPNLVFLTRYLSAEHVKKNYTQNTPGENFSDGNSKWPPSRWLETLIMKQNNG
jgi:hypothetical protein